jgi:hypothetical protein
MTVRLRPSVLRTASAILLSMAAFLIVSSSLADLPGEDWWSRAKTLLIPTGVFFAFVWVMFVPRRLEFSETEFTIQHLLGRRCVLSWDELEYYGPGNNVFMIQFFGQQAIQIFAAAYSRHEWHEFMSFLSDKFPERKASGWIGGHLFKWRK